LSNTDKGAVGLIPALELASLTGGVKIMEKRKRGRRVIMLEEEKIIR